MTQIGFTISTGDFGAIPFLDLPLTTLIECKLAKSIKYGFPQPDINFDANKSGVLLNLYNSSVVFVILGEMCCSFIFSFRFCIFWLSFGLSQIWLMEKQFNSGNKRF
jgi:hypothetical protein